MQDASKNMQILILLSTLIRVDWTSGMIHRGPRLWGQASQFFDPMCKVEAVMSCVIWFAVVCIIPRSEKERAIVPIWARWYCILIWCLCGPLLLVTNGIFWDSHVHLTMYAYICPYNGAMDTLAILPQLLILRSQNSVDGDPPAPWLGHVVGMLSINHLMRVLFWICYFWQGSALLSFALPDFIGLFVMSDFLIMYFRVLRLRAEELVATESLGLLSGFQKKNDEEDDDGFYSANKGEELRDVVQDGGDDNRRTRKKTGPPHHPRAGKFSEYAAGKPDSEEEDMKEDMVFLTYTGEGVSIQ